MKSNLGYISCTREPPRPMDYNQCVTNLFLLYTCLYFYNVMISCICNMEVTKLPTVYSSCKQFLVRTTIYNITKLGGIHQLGFQQSIIHISPQNLHFLRSEMLIPQICRLVLLEEVVHLLNVHVSERCI